MLQLLQSSWLLRWKLKRGRFRDRRRDAHYAVNGKGVDWNRETGKEGGGREGERKRERCEKRTQPKIYVSVINKADLLRGKGLLAVFIDYCLIDDHITD